ncbi:MAG TPA: glycoside hydrolase family 99-like domain-containing protein [Caulobacterales bacterium]|nr:glycoside hydrolase family 99-like domain-containing protein [Caulobacterales bacterium]
MKATFTLDARALAALTPAKRQRVLEMLASLAPREGQDAGGSSDEEIRGLIETLRAAPGVSLQDEVPAGRDRDEASRHELQAAAARLEKIARRLDWVAEERRASRELMRRLASSESHTRELERQVDAARAELEAMRGTLSWRLTAPLRLTRRIEMASLALWRRLKPRLHSAWARLRAASPFAPPVLELVDVAPPIAALPAPPDDTERADAPAALALQNAPVRVVAFYDPSVHRHWLEVAAGAPRFVDHMQPRLPRFAFYDPRAGDVLRQQAEQARRHGVEAFCFRVPWGAHQDAAAVLAQWRETGADLGFCLCFELVEGGTGDGADPGAFIRFAAPFLADPRYTKIGARPLIVLARPGGLAACSATVKAWRAHCAANNLGSPYIAYTQVSDDEDPALFGCDAAIETPPHLCDPRDISAVANVSDPEFVGRVLDYVDMRQRRVLWRRPAYPIFRGVCPGWDDEPVRPREGEALHGGRPSLFGAWVASAARETLAAISAPEQRVLFVNSWNDWTRGSAIEPDQKFGYGWLHALQGALADAGRPDEGPPPKLIVAVHVFYVDIFELILAQLARFTEPFELIVTCPEEKRDEVALMLERWNMVSRAQVHAGENRGRDVLPFLQAMAARKPAPEDIILKLHTKRSRHRADGAEWRDRMYASLLSGDAPRRALDAFRFDRTLGMVAPEGVLAPITLNLAPNEEAITALMARAGFDGIEDADVFAAGSMFYLRARHLEPILAQRIGPTDFEAEAGQLDGTLAHALERVFTLVVLRQKCGVIDAAPPRSPGDKAEPRSNAANWRLR